MANNLDLNPSPIGRIRNSLVDLMQKKILLPKTIVVVMDDDLLPKDKRNLSFSCGLLFHWLADEINKLIAVHHDRLPAKAKKEYPPTVIWISPPKHKNMENNDERDKMDRVMKGTISILERHILLRPKKVWDEQDGNLYRNGRFTTVSFKQFWLSFDSAIQFWDKHLASKGARAFIPGKEKCNSKFEDRRPRQFYDPVPTFFGKRFSNKYIWNRNDRSAQIERRLLKPPPTRC